MLAALSISAWLALVFGNSGCSSHSIANQDALLLGFPPDSQSNTNSLCSKSAVLLLEGDGSSSAVSPSLVSMDPSGFTLNFANAHPGRMVVLGIGP